MLERSGRIASSSKDHSVRMWDPAVNRPTRQRVTDAGIVYIVIAPSGLIVAGCADGAVHFLREVG